MKLIYDTTKWAETEPVMKNTLQFFITNRCNKRCKACFYGKSLGTSDMDFSYYKDLIYQYKDQNVQKIILIGGEPTLHPKLVDMIKFNQNVGLETTVYTNGTNLNPLEELTPSDLKGVSIRIGVLGLCGTEKNLMEIKTDLPVIVVFMLRSDNYTTLPTVAKYAEENFNCQGLMISSIRDIIQTGSFWGDTEDTLSNQFFAEQVQKFVVNYKGNLPSLHICRRATIDGKSHYNKCRYLNIYPNQEKTICPFDISLGIKDGEGYSLSSRTCQKHHECILQKIVLVKK